MIVLAKLNALEILQYEKAIMSRADSIKILYQELKTGILSLTDIQEQVDMNKKQVLDLHKKCITTWQGKKWLSGTAIYQKRGLNRQREKQIEKCQRRKKLNR